MTYSYQAKVDIFFSIRQFVPAHLFKWCSKSAYNKCNFTEMSHCVNHSTSLMLAT